jgi:hypothetical protein
MNAYAMFMADESLRLANERIADFRREAANDRLARRRVGTLASTLAAKVHAFVTALRVVDPLAPRTYPHIADYPYRG